MRSHQSIKSCSPPPVRLRLRSVASIALVPIEGVVTAALWAVVPPVTWAARVASCLSQELRLTRAYLFRGRHTFPSFAAFKANREAGPTPLGGAKHREYSDAEWKMAHREMTVALSKLRTNTKGQSHD